jgi:hypothetical protein
MKPRILLLLVAAAAMLAFAGAALAQSGHFNDRTVQCTDLGTTLQCTGKVSGLGGTTFEIVVEADGLATVECTNPGGNVAPGQDTAIDVGGSSGPLETPRNGNYNFTVTTDEPSVPNTPTCPNSGWTANVTDVAFSNITLTLFEDGVPVDSFP